MNPNLPFLFLVILSITFIFVALLCLLFYVYSPSSRRRRLLAKQAHWDYRNARGTAHLKLLKDSRPRLVNDINTLKSEVERSKNELKSLDIQQALKLRALLETQIIGDHLDEISGIGPKFREQLLRSVFRTKLSDLRQSSSMIHGIGDARQRQINAWVDQWESRLPMLLQTDFPGRSNIEFDYRTQIKAKSKRIEQLEETTREKEDLLNKLDELVKQLRSVGPTDFYQALIDPTRSSEKLDFYLSGAFAEWDSIPGWFKKIVGEDSQHA